MTALDETLVVARGLPSHFGAGLVAAKASSRGQSLSVVRFCVISTQIIADFIAIAGSALLARAISLNLMRSDSVAWQVAVQSHKDVAWLIMAGVLCGWFAVTGHYSIRRPLYEETKRIAATLAVIMLIHFPRRTATAHPPSAGRCELDRTTSGRGSMNSSATTARTSFMTVVAIVLIEAITAISRFALKFVDDPTRQVLTGLARCPVEAQNA
jgi:hypothetical protein